MTPIMANLKDGQDHEEKYFGKKISSQEMTTCNMEALVSFKEVMTNVFFLVKCRDQKVTYQQNDLRYRGHKKRMDIVYAYIITLHHYYTTKIHFLMEGNICSAFFN